MAKLNILNGAFGEIEPVESIDDLDPKVKFHVDPLLKACSPSLQALVGNAPEIVSASAVMTIEADEDIVNALKANLARAFEARFDRDYDQVLSTLDSRLAMGTGNSRAMILSIAGGRNNLENALHQERAIAKAGIQRLVNSLPDVQPYWVDVTFKGSYVSTDVENKLTHDRPVAIEPVSPQSAPVPMAGWGDRDHVHYTDSGADVQLEPGYYDMTVAVPIYLPAPNGGLLSQAQNTAARLFNFNQASQAPIPANAEAIAPSIEKTTQVMALIMENPELRKFILEGPIQAVADYRTCVETSIEGLQHNNSDDYDDDEDDDYPERNFPHPGM